MENSVLLVRIYLPKMPRFFSPREEKEKQRIRDSIITLIHTFSNHVQPFALFRFLLFSSSTLERSG